VRVARAHAHAAEWARVLAFNTESSSLKCELCAGLAWLGLALDADANDRCLGTEARISSAASMIDAHVIPVREEKAIAHTTQRCLTSAEEAQ
jgi:acetate kinase